MNQALNVSVCLIAPSQSTRFWALLASLSAGRATLMGRFIGVSEKYA